tara:strand:- start:95 stop:688 length:594 start_codon:yes stop_codon:yes gene_type:complete
MGDPLTLSKFDFSVAEFDKLPVNSFKEVVFAGRSNSGKSSVINAVTGQKGLARSSKTPGRTQLINFFSVRPRCFLVDLPGYGYARAPKNIKYNWENLLATYLQRRVQICGLVLIMDIRHPFDKRDIMLLDIFIPAGKPILFLLNKADKLSKREISVQEKIVTSRLDLVGVECHLEVFSATRGLGVTNVRKIINNWMS